MGFGLPPGAGTSDEIDTDGDGFNDATVDESGNIIDNNTGVIIGEIHPDIGAGDGNIVIPKSKIDVDQISNIYDTLNVKIREDLQRDYDCKKINGTTFADTWSKMMVQVISSSIGAVVSLQNNETTYDVLTKHEQIRALHQKTIDEHATSEENNLLTEQKRIAEEIKNGVNTDYADRSIYELNRQVLNAQRCLYERQAKGFDDNKRQKYLDSLAGPFSILFQDLSLNDASLPFGLTEHGMNSAMEAVSGIATPDKVGDLYKEPSKPNLPVDSKCGSATSVLP